MSKRLPAVIASTPTGSFHLSHKDAYVLVKRGGAEAVDAADLSKGIRVVPELVCRGLSCRVGEYLATEIAKRSPVARVMLDHIQLRRSPPCQQQPQSNC